MMTIYHLAFLSSFAELLCLAALFMKIVDDWAVFQTAQADLLSF